MLRVGQTNPILEAFCIPFGSKQSQEHAVGLELLFSGQTGGETSLHPHSPQKDGVLHCSTPTPLLWHSVM